MFDPNAIQEMLGKNFDEINLDDVEIEITETGEDSDRSKKNGDLNHAPATYRTMFKQKRSDSWNSTTVNVNDPVNLIPVKTKCDCCRKIKCKCCNLL